MNKSGFHRDRVRRDGVTVCLVLLGVLLAGFLFGSCSSTNADREAQARARVLYEEGRAEWSKRTPAGLARSAESFRAALQFHPRFALAHSGLADSLALLGLYSHRSPEESFPEAKAASLEALAIDPDLAEAHASLALCLYLFDRDWRGAEDGFRRAIDLRPDYATVRHWYAMFLTAAGRPEEAVVSMKKALAIEPGSKIIGAKLGTVLAAAGRLDEAEKQLLGSLGRFPEFALAHRELGNLRLLQGDLEGACEEYEEAIRLDGGSVRSVAGLAHIDARAGRRKVAESVLAELLRRVNREDRYLSPLAIVLVFAGLGELDEAFRWVQRAYDQYDPGLVYLGVKPGYEPLRRDPRFDEWVERLGIGR